ncbi:FAD-dependent oxidoreductase [Halomicroarcula sp. GCM10025710]
MQDITIVGGGIAGCSTAYLLSERGYDVTVVEKDAIGGFSGRSSWRRAITQILHHTSSSSTKMKRPSSASSSRSLPISTRTRFSRRPTRRTTSPTRTTIQ